VIKIIVFSDLHGNDIALKEILKYAEINKVNHVFSLGDTISIGPNSFECLNILQNIETVTNSIGNHEEYFLKGLANKPDCMSLGKLKHQNWVHASLTKQQKNFISTWDYLKSKQFNNIRITFMHSPINESDDYFSDFQNLKDMDSVKLDFIFKNFDSEIIFYGHSHKFSDITGYKRYINPGSVSCHLKDKIRFSVLTILDRSYNVEHVCLKYEQKILLKYMDLKNMPEKELIKKIFYYE
jgi:predicted phosphodiesterase